MKFYPFCCEGNNQWQNIILFFVYSNCKSQQQKLCKLLPRMNIVNCFKWAIICFVGKLRNIWQGHYIYIYIYILIHTHTHTHTYLGWPAQILMKFVYSFLCKLFLKIQSEKVHLSWLNFSQPDKKLHLIWLKKIFSISKNFPVHHTGKRLVYIYI